MRRLRIAFDDPRVEAEFVEWLGAAVLLWMMAMAIAWSSDGW